jgi:GAF domain-containing protein
VPTFSTEVNGKQKYLIKPIKTMKEADDAILMFAPLLDKIRKIIEEPADTNDKLLAICRLLGNKFSHYDWVGFYLVDKSGKRELVLGPFTGEPTEHVRIPLGKGICGQAAEKKVTIIVQDVSKEKNYLSCSPEVKAEIVVPIFKNGKVVGELDIDSHTLSPFTEEERKFLEDACEIVSMLF